MTPKDRIFVESLKDGSMPESSFTHINHLRLAFVFLEERELSSAIEEVCSTIQSYVRVNQLEAVYHETLTVASVCIVHEFRQLRPELDLDELILTFPALQTQFKELVLSHYSEELLYSTAAKSGFVEPDLLPFSAVRKKEKKSASQ